MMRAVFMAGERRIIVDDVAMPERCDDEVIVAVKACGLCGSEMSRYAPALDEKVLTGHETAGVVEVPCQGGRLKAGDRVVLNTVAGCGECDYCRRGQENYCTAVFNSRGRRPDGHTEKVVYLERNCLPIPEDMSFESAIAVGGCGIGVAWHGIKRLGIEKGDIVPVWGVGPIGLAAVMLIKYLGARPVAVDISDYRLQLALKLGAEAAIKNEQSESINDYLHRAKEQVHKTIICSGNHDAARAALSCLSPLGTALVLGGLSKFPFESWEMIGIGDKSIMGSWHYHREEWPEILSLVEAGLPVDAMVTHVYPLAQAQEAYKAFAAGNTGKVVLRV